MPMRKLPAQEVLITRGHSLRVINTSEGTATLLISGLSVAGNTIWLDLQLIGQNQNSSHQVMHTGIGSGQGW